MEEIATTDEPRTTARGGAVGTVVDQLRRRILSGTLAPGQRLIEADLTRELGVSRSTMREAYRQLSADGLTETVANRGTIVMRIGRDEMLELYEIRQALETLAAANAASLIAHADNRKQMEAMEARLAADHADYSRDDFFQENWDFHVLVANVSGNRRLSALLQQLQTPMILFRANRDLAHTTSLKAVDEHLAIARLILDADIDGARMAMRSHLDHSLGRLPLPGPRFPNAAPA